MIKINLLPPELQEKDKGLDWVIVGYAAIGLFALAFGSTYYAKLHQYKKDVAKKEKWSQALTAIKAKVAQIEQLDAQKSILMAKKSTVLQLLQGRLLYPKFMETFFETLPSDIWITDLSISEDSGKNLNVIALSNSLTADSIADWMQTLEARPDRFSNIQLSAIDVKTNADPKQASSSYAFSMSLTYQPPAVPNG